ncbi:catalase [Catenovulum adriaticum]|uniref:Catalase n=1 Tax=Catenovulum adriaticum TaxID=2984846 RepID=A0ABY7ALJ1_9ALTE|nr:catalase [Catenovulum sp. TS8]WAJ70409.1 catalase [Catenovulum sp. TS8]
MAETFKYGKGQGKGGELHQHPNNSDEVMTSAQGCPVSDDQNSLKGGSRGPTLMEDHILREKLFHFDHERIPERVVHARGYGAHGYFETYDEIADLTCADLFQRKNEKTPVFVRFSTVAGSQGSPDLARDVRGFAVKFYTKEGNWDLVGNNIPVFFIQDAMKFPDLVHSAKAEPDRGFPQAQTAHDNFWDFISLTPESMHMIMWAMSDRAIPRSLRFMEGFGVHTFKFVNAQGVEKFVKFHWKPKLGLQSVVWNEALKLNGADPDFHRRDLWDSILAGDFPEWELGVQVFDQTFADQFEFDILDPTKLIPEEDVPVQKVGRMVLNSVVDNFFAETEQVAFCTQNIVPGIDFTEDPLLQGRNFSYLDTQLKRLGGPNFTHLPINAPKCPLRHFQQDGHMAMQNPKGRANYEPNSWDRGEDNPRACPEHGFKSSQETISGSKVRYRSETFSDHYSQAVQFYKSQTEVEQQHIQSALVFELSKVEEPKIRERVVSHLLNIDEKLANVVAQGLGFPEMPEPAEAAMPARTDLKVSDALSILKNPPATFKGRKLGILATNGLNQDIFDSVKAALEVEGAMFEIIAPTRSGVKTDSGTVLPADQIVNGGPSVLYDAVLLLTSTEGAKELSLIPEAKDFVMDAFAHNKFIGYTDDCLPLLKETNLDSKMDDGFYELTKLKGDKFMTILSQLRFWRR